MASLEYHRELLHYFTQNSPDRLIFLLPATVPKTNGKFDLSTFPVTLEGALAALELFVLENFVGPSIRDRVPAWAQQDMDFELDGEHASHLDAVF